MLFSRETVNAPSPPTKPPPHPPPTPPPPPPNPLAGSRSPPLPVFFCQKGDLFSFTRSPFSSFPFTHTPIIMRTSPLLRKVQIFLLTFPPVFFGPLSEDEPPWPDGGIYPFQRVKVPFISPPLPLTITSPLEGKSSFLDYKGRGVLFSSLLTASFPFLAYRDRKEFFFPFFVFCN